MKSLSFKLICSIMLALVIGMASSVVIAKTPDGEPPSVETVCDVFAGLNGPEFGLCNAYCEAMDCDSPNTRASERACDRVLNNFRKHSDAELPCIAVVSCPCETDFIDSGLLDSTEAECESEDDGGTTVTYSQSEFIYTSGGEGVCGVSVEGEAGIEKPVNAEQAQVCNSYLQATAVSCGT